MASTFRPVNTALDPLSMNDNNEAMMVSPTTPRPGTAPLEGGSQIADDATTPTRANFNGAALASQKPLPTSPFPESVQVPEPVVNKNSPKREGSQYSRKSRDVEDMDMDDSDGEGANGDDAGGSDDESVDADGTRSNKKKRSQRFYCTDYPPCNLSFTRSEHLARHIRKHTGERPFQCHCSRRFSRLDNLRQHAQTVHVNEDIPMDSLAATGTRFQRQIRTDRVRQATGRARASTAGSVGPPGRGHSKSLSTSSIASVSSVGSNYSANDARRRPPPLVMADPRSRLSLESYRNAADGQLYRAPSPSDFSTPTSATFSTGQNSPRWGSGVASPTSSHSRSHSMYATGSRTPGRRLSVPSSGNPFQSPHGFAAGRPVFGPGIMNTSNSGVFSPGDGSLLSSPVAPPSGGWSRRDSASSTADEAWRRRTWHPDTRETFVSSSSRLSQVITPSQFAAPQVPLPLPNPNQQQQSTLRLPGIESFDPIPQGPITPPRRIPSPMMIDSDAKPPSDLIDNRRPSLTAHWDMGLHRGLTRLDINTPPRESPVAWPGEISQSEQARATAPQQPTVRFDTDVKTVPPPIAAQSVTSLSSRHHHTMSAPAAARETKRHGWYHGPVTVRETIHEGQAPAPRPPHVDRIVHPNVSQFQGFPARLVADGQQQQQHQQPYQHQQPQVVLHQESGQVGPNSPEPRLPQSTTGSGSGNGDSLRRLEALVAVATSEGSTATAY